MADHPHLRSKVIFITLLCTLSSTCLFSFSCNRDKENSLSSVVDQPVDEKQEIELKKTALVGQKERSKKKLYKFFQELMGTQFNIDLYAYDKQIALSSARAAFNEIRRIEFQVSTWKPKSELGRLNLSAGQKPVDVSYQTAWLLCKSKKISSITRGAFDITWASLKGLWDFKKRHIPNYQVLKSRLTLVGNEYLTLEIKDANGVKKNCTDLSSNSPHPAWTKFYSLSPEKWKWKYRAFITQKDTQIDLGGIAKGFAVDQASRVLKRLGFSDFIIDGGGDLYVEGRQLDHHPWSVGIRHPRVDKIWTRLWVPSGWSVVTSGDYERFFYEGSTRYHHIIDLRTGFPAQGSVSTTVIARQALLADALATAIFILGPREGIALADSLSGVEALCFAPTGEVYTSQGAHIFGPSLPSYWRQ